MFIGGVSGMYRAQAYEGHFYQGKPWGRGKLIYPDGTNVQGNFKAGHPCGLTTVVFPSGRPRQAFFTNGTLMEWVGTMNDSVLWMDMKQLRDTKQLGNQEETESEEKKLQASIDKPATVVAGVMI